MARIAFPPKSTTLAHKFSNRRADPTDFDILEASELDTMKTDLQGKLRNVSLPPKQPLLPLFEAVVNAIEAIREAGDVTAPKVSIKIIRDNDLIGPGEAAFTDFCVSDNGIGFTKTNYTSFETSNSRHKANKGGKGLGRFTWLKAFERAEIDSQFRDGETLKRLNFVFSPQHDELNPEFNSTIGDAPQTTVKLRGFLDPWKRNCPRELSTIAHRLTEHLVLHLLDEKCPEIEIMDGQNSINIRTYFTENFAKHAQVHTTQIGASEFKVTGFRLSDATARHHQALYTAHQRVVLAKQLDKIIPNLSDARIEDPGQGKFLYRVYIESTILDEHVNNERTGFVLPEADSPDTQENLLEPLPSMRGILDAVIEKVEGDLRPFLTLIERDKKNRIEAYINEQAPQYRPLKAHMTDVVEKLPPDPTDRAIERALHEKRFQIERDVRDQSAKIIEGISPTNDTRQARETLREFMDKNNALGVSALADHVMHRRIVLEIYGKSLCSDSRTGTYVRESKLHDIFFPRYHTSDDLGPEDQNLWLIDERLTFHHRLYSEIQLRKTDEIETASQARPDILIFNKPVSFSEDGIGEQQSSIALVEFKRPQDGVSNPTENPLEQCFRIIRQIRSERLKDVNGHRIKVQSKELPAYIYVICDPGNYKIGFENLSAARTPDGKGYFGYNTNLNAYYEIVSYDKILTDAHKRNLVLFKKLNLPNVLPPEIANDQTPQIDDTDPNT